MRTEQVSRGSAGPSQPGLPNSRDGGEPDEGRLDSKPSSRGRVPQGSSRDHRRASRGGSDHQLPHSYALGGRRTLDTCRANASPALRTRRRFGRGRSEASAAARMRAPDVSGCTSRNDSSVEDLATRILPCSDLGSDESATWSAHDARERSPRSSSEPPARVLRWAAAGARTWGVSRAWRRRAPRAPSEDLRRVRGSRRHARSAEARPPTPARARPLSGPTSSTAVCVSTAMVAGPPPPPPRRRSGRPPRAAPRACRMNRQRVHASTSAPARTSSGGTPCERSNQRSPPARAC
jgi:hypothetical protein